MNDRNHLTITVPLKSVLKPGFDYAAFQVGLAEDSILSPVAKTQAAQKFNPESLIRFDAEFTGQSLSNLVNSPKADFVTVNRLPLATGKTLPGDHPVRQLWEET